MVVVLILAGVGWMQDFLTYPVDVLCKGWSQSVEEEKNSH